MELTIIQIQDKHVKYEPHHCRSDSLTLRTSEHTHKHSLTHTHANAPARSHTQWPILVAIYKNKQ